MAGSSMTFEFILGRTLKKIIVDWVSDDTTGSVSGVTIILNGVLGQVVTVPGTPAPTDNYDIVLTDEFGLDILADSRDNLLNRDTVTTESILTNLESDGAGLRIAAYPVLVGKMTISVTNAGNSKKGRIVFISAPVN